MTTPARSADPPAERGTTAATDETEPASSLQARVCQAGGEVARSLPPMTAEQAALVRRALRSHRSQRR